MKKNIIITSGPTNERIDSVMKITNMSTGALGSIIADNILNEKNEEIENLFYISPKLAYKPKINSDKLKLITIDSTEELLKELKNLLTSSKIDGVIHSAAVGDYTGEYTITGEMLANDISLSVLRQMNSHWHRLSIEQIKEAVVAAIKNPKSLTDNSGKISSYEENLMVKLKLTPKVISHIKNLSPTTKLIGFKLLDGVSKEELQKVGLALLNKNKADYIVANDLSKIGNGLHPAMILDKDGIFEECETKQEIAKSLTKVLFK